MHVYISSLLVLSACDACLLINPGEVVSALGLESQELVLERAKFEGLLVYLGHEARALELVLALLEGLRESVQLVLHSLELNELGVLERGQVVGGLSLEAFHRSIDVELRLV